MTYAAGERVGLRGAGIDLCLQPVLPLQHQRRQQPVQIGDELRADGTGRSSVAHGDVPATTPRRPVLSDAVEVVGRRAPEEPLLPALVEADIEAPPPDGSRNVRSATPPAATTCSMKFTERVYSSSASAMATRTLSGTSAILEAHPGTTR